MDKKELIIVAALKLFVENGFHGTATGKIAQEAGVATGTLFQYFKTKDELIIALYINIKKELTEYIANNKTDNISTKEVMKSQILASLFWALDNKIKFNFIQQFHTSPYIKQVEQEIINQQELPHLTLIQKGINEGLIKDLPVDLIYSLISSHTYGLYHYLASKELSKLEQQNTIQTVFELLWNTLI